MAGGEAASAGKNGYSIQLNAYAEVKTPSGDAVLLATKRDSIQRRYV